MTSFFYDRSHLVGKSVENARFFFRPLWSVENARFSSSVSNRICLGKTSIYMRCPDTSFQGKHLQIYGKRLHILVLNRHSPEALVTTLFSFTLLNKPLPKILPLKNQRILPCYAKRTSNSDIMLLLLITFLIC